MNFEDFIDSNFVIKNIDLTTTKFAPLTQTRNASNANEIYIPSFGNDFLNINSLVTIFMLLLIFILLSVLFCLIMCIKMYLTPALFNSQMKPKLEINQIENGIMEDCATNYNCTSKNDTLFRIEEEIGPNTSVSTFFPNKSVINGIESQSITNSEVVGSKIKQCPSETTFIPYQ